MKAGQPEWAVRLQNGTEAVLTWRKRRRLRKKAKQQAKNVVVDWIEAFLWAAAVVLLINQYLLQAYQIPSGSMTSTLLVEDRIFVNKIIYGPELIPGMVKLPGFAEPQRGEVIIFENPDYLSRGPLFDIVQRVLYMVTLSLVDIDRDATGAPRAHFLIKRAVGVGSDRFRMREGLMEIKPLGEAEWIPEASLQEATNLEYSIRRLVSGYEDYPGAALAATYGDLRIPVPQDAQNALAALDGRSSRDMFELERLEAQVATYADPSDRLSLARYSVHDLGWYIPPDRIFPMGDNRDNSRDARWFGAVAERDVLGRAMFKYWPISRFGAIR